MNRSSSLLPLMAIFEIEEVLFSFNFQRDCILFPCSKDKNNRVVDNNNDRVESKLDVNAVFEKLKNSSIKIAIIYTINPYLTVCKSEHIIQLINLYGWDKYVSFPMITDKYPLDNLKKLEEVSNIPLNKSIYFKWTDKILPSHKQEPDKRLIDKGIFTVDVTSSEDTLMETVVNALEEYESNGEEIEKFIV